jgi:hypothetical protein
MLLTDPTVPETLPDHNKVLTEEDLIAEVDSRIRSQEVILRDFHRQWFVNVAMRRGLQYIQTHAGTGLVIMPPDSEDRVRIVVNRMLGIHQTRVAKLSTDLPKLEAISASAQEEDKDSARKGTKLLSWVWSNEKMVEKMLKALTWTVDCCDSFLYPTWDVNKGREIPIYKRHKGPITENMSYKVDQEGYILDDKGDRIQDKISIGDVSIEVLSPFDIINDGVSETVQDSDWIIIQKATSINSIRMKWGERAKKVVAERDLNTRAYFQRRLQTMVGNQSTYFAPEPKHYEDMAIVKTLFEKASDKYPQGRRIVIANGVLLECGPMPYAHGLYPLVKIGDIEISGSFWDVSTMENLIPIQKGFNRTWSQILENANNMGNIKVVLDKGHGLQKESYDDTGCEVLEKEPEAQITQLQPAELPSYVVNQLTFYDKAFEDVSGQHEMKQAVDAGIKSGKALLVLQEQDDTRLAPTKIRFHRAMEEVGYMVLQLYAEFQDEEREYQILGDSAYDIDEFKITPKEIKSMKKDVRVQSENIIASHVRLRQENLMDLVTQGIFDETKFKPDVAKKILKLYEFGQVDELFDNINLDRSQARQENQQFINATELIEIPSPTPPLPGMEGLPNTVLSLPAYDFEDHAVHILEHNSLRKSPRYRQMTENLRKGIDTHVKIHENFLQGVSPTPTPEQGMPPPPPQGAPAPGAGQGLSAVPPPPPMQPPPLPPEGTPRQIG